MAIQHFAAIAAILTVAVITHVSVPAQASAPVDGDARVETSHSICLPWHGDDYLKVFSEDGNAYCFGGAGTADAFFRKVYAFHSGNNQGNIRWCGGHWTPFDKWVDWSFKKDRCMWKITIY